MVGAKVRTVLATSIPSNRGKPISSRIRSGPSSLAFWIASNPSEASATWKRRVCFSSEQANRRNGSKSSTTKILGRRTRPLPQSRLPIATTSTQRIIRLARQNNDCKNRRCTYMPKCLDPKKNGRERKEKEVKQSHTRTRTSPVYNDPGSDGRCNTARRVRSRMPGGGCHKDSSGGAAFPWPFRKSP